MTHGDVPDKDQNLSTAKFRLFHGAYLSPGQAIDIGRPQKGPNRRDGSGNLENATCLCMTCESMHDLQSEMFISAFCWSRSGFVCQNL